MSQKTIVHNTFYEGISPYEKLTRTDGKSAARFIKNVNIHEDPSYFTLMPGLNKISGSTVTDLVKWSETSIPYATDNYHYGDTGKLYKETSGGTWSVDRTVSGGAGQGLLVYNDYLYYATSTTIGRLGTLSNSPTYADDFLSDGTTNIDQSDTSTGNTYTVPTAISETATNRQTFTPLRDPLKAIVIKVASAGSGDWTITVHDSANRVVGTITVVNGSITGSANNTFTFSTPLNLIIANTYHFHVTVSGGTSTITTGTSANMETAYFQSVFGILTADTLWHPMKNHLNLVCTGNGRYLSVWDEATYNPNRLVLAAGFKIRSLTVQKEFLVMAAWKGTSIDAVTEGRLYYWDGISTTFNYYESINLGLPNVIHTSKNRLFGIYGSRGMIHLYNEPFKKIQEIPYLARGKKIEVYPGAITEWQGRTYVGIAGSTDDGSSLIQGVYEYGNKTDDLPDALACALTISTGTTQSTSVSIGSVKSFGKSLYVSWKDGSSYGVDKTTSDGTAALSGSYEQLIFDDESPQNNEIPNKIVISFLPLASGESVTPKYRADRSTPWITGTTVSTVGETRAEFAIDPIGRINEIEYGCDIASSNGTYHKITGVFYMYDNLDEEAQEGGL